VALLFVSVFTSCATRNPSREFARELESFPDGGIVIEGIKDENRQNAQHGVFALAPLIQFWGRPPLSAEQMALLTDDPAQMIPVEETMTVLLEERGLWPFAFYGTMDELETRLSAGVPVLVILQNNPALIETRRYVIVSGFNREAKKLLVHDGDSVPTVYTYAQFKRLWRPVRNWMMVVCPPEHVSWEMRIIERVGRARYWERRLDWQSALRDYEAVEQQDPFNTDLMLAKAHALFGSGDIDAAVALYRNVLQIDGLNARAANNLAYSLAESGGDLILAEKMSRRALTIEPSNPSYLDTLGLILLKLKRPKDASVVLEKALYRSENLDRKFQRTITTRLIEAFLDSGQSHLAKQVWSNHQLKDPDYFLPQQLMDRMP